MYSYYYPTSVKLKLGNSNVISLTSGIRNMQSSNVSYLSTQEASTIITYNYQPSGIKLKSYGEMCIPLYTSKCPKTQ